MTGGIKAIETEYRGYRFRSRLEARWAVFFDAMGYSWEYEPEGFDLGEAGWYLPDFKLKLPRGEVQWCEVKPDGGESLKAKAMDRLLSRDRVTVLEGDPFAYFGEGGKDICPNCGGIDTINDKFLWSRHYIHPEIWRMDCTNCPGRGVNTPAFRDYCLKTHGDDNWERPDVVLWPKEWSLMLGEIRKAANAARGARFEHGEKGNK